MNAVLKDTLELIVSAFSNGCVKAPDLRSILECQREELEPLLKSCSSPVRDPVAEEGRLLLLESLEIYAECFEALLDHLEDPENLDLTELLSAAQDASDLMVSVEYLVHETRSEMPAVA